MTKANIPQYSATAASNTDVQDIDIAENCAPSGINNAIREIMADLKDQDTGAVAMTSPVATSLTVTNEITANGGIALGDNDKATFGASDDLEIYHDGSHSYIDESGGTGNLRIRATNLVLQSVGEEDYATFVANGAATLFYDNAEKIATSSTGIDVTGNASFADNGKATFGAGDDLQIYHNANNSFIQDAGTGSLYIDGSASVNIRETSTNAPMAVLTGSGSVDLYHNGIKKLATTATGIDVTGDVNTSGLLKVGTNDTEYANNYIRFKPTGATYIDHSVVGQNINFRLSNASSLDSTPLVVSPTGIDVTGDITVSGGITFSDAGSSGTASSNLLDAYEEGSYTVQLFDASAGGNASSSSVTGRYTKIGNQVTVRFDSLNNIDTTGMTGANDLYFSLPFSASSTGRSVGSVVFDNLTFIVDRTMITPIVTDSSSRGQFRTTGSAVSDQITEIQDINSGTDIMTFTLTYFTD